MTVRPCWTCKQPATHALTRDGSIPLDACDNCTRIDRAEAERRGWTVTPIGGTNRKETIQMDEIGDCTCIEFCDEDPSYPGAYGPCPVHPERPGDR